MLQITPDRPGRKASLESNPISMLNRAVKEQAGTIALTPQRSPTQWLNMNSFEFSSVQSKSSAA